ncbi:MAG: endolytic transglycosylase MltG [Elusimicrobiota bacterium]|jgi:UPF0755 protein|nr:endolytic transglycosylase MltG [Elusimicrobiota bacterium]
MDKVKLVKISAVILAIIIIVGAMWYVSLSGKMIEVAVNKGDSAHKVSDTLKKEGIIYSKTIFLALVKLTGSSAKIQSGNYDFSKKDNIFTVLSHLRKGSKNYISITIPEGSNVKQIAAIVKSKIPEFDAENFIQIADNEDLEGYLMPETYYVGYNFKAENMIRVMREEFDKKVTPEMYERAEEIGMSIKDIIILASIVEKEAMKKDERAVIAGVFYNRLEKRIRLESCATVLYAMGINKPQLSLADLKYPSPYNTYLHYGLPPGPICSPGIESIKATLYPVKTDNLFFVAEGEGGHLFSPNLEEHVKNKNVAKAKQRERAAQSKKAAAPKVDRQAAAEAARLLDARQIAK